MFVKSVSLQVYWLEGVETGRQVLETLQTKEKTPEPVNLEQNGRRVEDLDALLLPVTVHVVPRGRDGKGNPNPFKKV